MLEILEKLSKEPKNNQNNNGSYSSQSSSAPLPSFDKILMKFYNFFPHSGRLMLFLSKDTFTQPFKKEKQGFHYYNLDFYNKEYKKAIEFYVGRGLALTIYCFENPKLLSAQNGFQKSSNLIDDSLSDMRTIVSRTGGNLYFFREFDIQK